MNCCSPPVLLAVFISCLSGCASPIFDYPPYVVPAGSEKATLNLSTSAAPVWVTVFPGNPCTKQLPGASIARFARDNEGDPVLGVDREILAGNEFYFRS